MKYALFKHPTMPSIIAARDEEEVPYINWVRISEWVDVDFPARKREDVIPEQLALIDAEIKEQRLKAAAAVEALETARANLLAISDQRVSA